MFITKRQMILINLLSGVILAFGIWFILLDILFAFFDYFEISLICCGALIIVCGLIIRSSMMKSLGASYLLLRGSRLVSRELKPRQFIDLYEKKSQNPKNVISEPNFNALQLLANAYDLTGETEKERDTLKLLVALAPSGKKSNALLLKASFLYSVGETEEAERIFTDVGSGKMSLSAKMLYDMIIKTDRAFALGDYTVSEKALKEYLTSPFYRRNSSVHLITHFLLAKLFYATDRIEEAKPHIEYCIENCGETVFGEKAEKLREKHENK